MTLGLFLTGAFAGRAQTNTLVVSTNAVTVVAGVNSTFTVRLSDQPTNDVAVTVARTSGNSSLIVLSGASLTFTSNNFSTAQTVTLSAPTTAANGSATITISASGFTNQTVTATVTGGSGGGGGFTGIAAFQIKIKGELMVDEDDMMSPVKFGTDDIAGSLRLVLVVDTENNQISMVTADSVSVVDVLACSTRCAFVTNGQFDASICFPDLAITTDSFSGFGTGEMQLRGKLVVDPDTAEPKSLSARVFAVYNDSVNGNTAEPNVLMKAMISSSKAPFDAGDIGWNGDECDFFDCDAGP